jgi:hypothetical protein
MFNPFVMLALESNRVIAQRMMKLMRGGKGARREAELMVSEKIAAALEASASLMAGASSDDIVRRYREHVAANSKRLGKRKANRSRKNIFRLKRRRRS